MLVSVLDRLQSALEAPAAARELCRVFSVRRSQHIMPLLRDLRCSCQFRSGYASVSVFSCSLPRGHPSGGRRRRPSSPALVGNGTMLIVPPDRRPGVLWRPSTGVEQSAAGRPSYTDIARFPPTTAQDIL